MKQNRFFVFITMALFSTMAACHTTKKMATTQPKAPVPSPMEEKTAPAAASVKTDAWLEGLLASHPGYFDTLLQQRKELKLQVIYTQIDRQSDNSPLFKTYYFNVDSGDYLYPASTVKMPVALLALQHLHEMAIPGLDKYSSLITEAAYSKQTPVYNDPAAADGRPSVAQYVKKIFLVSDNDAFNRLYEFLGQQYINDQLHKMGYSDVQILHHLELRMTADENRHTNPVKFYDPGGKLLYSQPMQFNQTVYAERHDSLGKSWYNDKGKLINTPMDFSVKNRISLEDLTNILKSVLFPAVTPARQRFNLTAEDYRWVRKYMSQLPSETDYLRTDTVNYWDAYVKFLLYGSEKGSLPGQIRIFNKPGDAYGCLTDVAYIADFDKKIEFMLSARIYCNKSGIINSDKYDYDTIGLPFMKHLGQVIYEYELTRPRQRQPDLSEFKMVYDK
jgi:beta-lactamase class A